MAPEPCAKAIEVEWLLGTSVAKDAPERALDGLDDAVRGRHMRRSVLLKDGWVDQRGARQSVRHTEVGAPELACGDSACARQARSRRTRAVGGQALFQGGLAKEKRPRGGQVVVGGRG